MTALQLVRVTPDVAKTKGKCAISTLIFRKFSGGYAPRPPYLGGALWRGYSAPPQTPLPLGAPALRASLGTFGPSIVVSPLTKILATRLTTIRLRLVAIK